MILGRRTEVDRAVRKIARGHRGADWWALSLRCGHTTYRPVKKRRGRSVTGEDAAPTFVYCRQHEPGQ